MGVVVRGRRWIAMGGLVCGPRWHTGAGRNEATFALRDVKGQRLRHILSI